MILSMTGFGTRSREIADVRYSAEIRTVNGRYFKAAIRLPDLWSHLEAKIDRRLRGRLRRGSIQFVLRTRSSSAALACDVNVDALERYIEQLDVVRPDQADVNLSVDLASLLLLPGVCSPPVPEEIPEAVTSELLGFVDETIDAVLEMRAKEGQVIAEDLRRQCLIIEQNLAEVARRAGGVIEEYHRRLKQRVEQLIASAELNLNEQDLAREVAIFAERCDISEELSRLGGHIGQFRDVMTDEDAPGRKLDFIAQEMLREANTIAAKANDGQITRSVVEIKSAVDRIKEQVQNVE